eukprot:gnl/TRDRNA2_/TRDRNA2_187919_c0_seq1.p1 gnl/TRDRNA2_/TRDRNA2_187919_c0~~gnl/TRDRNA2_/TRDRNA2_187919_c0_seq1.p1  ORF type:complete len:742 (-),score=177.21 gnl/TRDRNA2_/TRDRNA2_187919_c0_seq1:39-2198(-)
MSDEGDGGESPELDPSAAAADAGVTDAGCSSARIPVALGPSSFPRHMLSDAALAAAYLRRLGFGEAAASSLVRNKPLGAKASGTKALLCDLVRRHVLRVPFDNLEQHRLPGGDDVGDVDARIPTRLARLREGRLNAERIAFGGPVGGICFDLNPAFAWLLRELGASVRLSMAWVALGADEGPGYKPTPTHVALLVDTVEGTVLVDPGFGDPAHTVVPLSPDAGETSDALATLEVTHDGESAPGPGFTAVLWRRRGSASCGRHLAAPDDAALDGAEQDRHAVYAFRPEDDLAYDAEELLESFLRVLTQQSLFTAKRFVCLGIPSGHIILSEHRMRHVEGGQLVEEKTINNDEEWLAAAADVFARPWLCSPDGEESQTNGHDLAEDQAARQERRNLADKEEAEEEAARQARRRQREEEEAREEAERKLRREQAKEREELEAREEEERKRVQAQEAKEAKARQEREEMAYSAAGVRAAWASQTDQMAKSNASQEAAASKAKNLGTVDSRSIAVGGAGAGGGMGLNRPGFGPKVKSFAAPSAGTSGNKKAIEVDAEVMSTWSQILDDADPLSWLLCTYSSDSKTLNLKNSGSGGLKDFKSELGDSLAWGGFRCYGIDRRGGLECKRSKFIFVQYKPENVSAMKKAKQGSHKGDIKEALPNCHLDLIVETLQDLDEQSLIVKLQAATGAHKPNGYEFDEGHFLEADYYGLGIGAACKGESQSNT